MNINDLKELPVLFELQRIAKINAKRKDSSCTNSSQIRAFACSGSLYQTFSALVSSPTLLSFQRNVFFYYYWSCSFVFRFYEDSPQIIEILLKKNRTDLFINRTLVFFYRCLSNLVLHKNEPHFHQFLRTHVREIKYLMMKKLSKDLEKCKNGEYVRGMYWFRCYTSLHIALKRVSFSSFSFFFRSRCFEIVNGSLYTNCDVTILWIVRHNWFVRTAILGGVIMQVTIKSYQ